MSKYSHFSKAGRKGTNQDSVLVCSNGTRSIIAIADGMGGKEAGELASKIAVDTIKRDFESDGDFDLGRSFRNVKNEITDFSTNNGIKQMGTTLTVCLMNEGKATVAHVGDTRLYHLRNSGIVSITKDQTEVQKLIDDGVLSKKRAVRYHRRNVLLSAMTNFSDYALFQTEFYISPNDRLLLLSDGAYDLINKVEIRDLSVQQETVIDLNNSIMNLIESRTIKDDYTVVAFEV